MNPLDRLQNTLRNINRVSLSKIRPGDLLPILAERALLEKWLGGVALLEDETADTIEAALMEYEQNGYIRGSRQLRLLCYGCTQSSGNKSHRLIEDADLFEKLFGFVDHYRNRQRTFRKCYRGLLNAYFSYDPFSRDATPAGCDNWRALRNFLATRQGSVRTRGFTPEWIAALTQHAGLLSDNPCHHYERSSLQDDWSVFADLRERLDIGEDSWLFRLMVMAQVEAATNASDSELKEHLAKVLLLLKDHPLHAAAGLTRLLDRYAKCAEPEISAPLRDFAVKLWSNPWLPASAQQWLCGETARKMVSRWLKLHLLGEFFSLLSDDAKFARRFDFWSLYCDDIQGLYFALGKSAFARGDIALHKFRRDAKGLIVRLAEGNQDIHACILQLEHHHVVEFNRHNNVAYFYDSRLGTPPFYLSKGWLEVGAMSVVKLSQGIDVSPLSKPLRHQDTKNQSWEGRFAQELGATDASIAAFCREHTCQYEDTRERNGCRWIRPSESAPLTHLAQSMLAGWGFALFGEQNLYFHTGNLSA